MKKAFSLALVLCMLLATVVIPTTAADPAQSAPIYNIPTDAETYTIDGVVYNVIRTADQFKAIDGTIAAPVNYILACDIDLGGTTITGANCGVINRKWKSGILEGNGFAIYGYQGNDVNNGALFAFPWDKTSHVFKNVSFGKSGNEIVMTTSGNGSCAAVIGKIYQDSSAAFYNCKAYVNFTDSDPSATKGQKGAFIGCSNRGNTSVYFENCETYGTISGSYGIGGYYGNINKDHTGLTFTFINCVNNVNLTATNEVGGFFGGNTTNVVDAQFTFVNCVNNGTLSIGSGKPKGDLIGKSVSTVPVNVTVPVSEAASLNDGAFGSIAAYPNVTLMANGDGTASAGWQKTTADDNGKRDRNQFFHHFVFSFE